MSGDSKSSIKMDMSANANADLTKVSNEVLSNLFMPASKQIGKALGNAAGLINTATLPIRFVNQYAKKNYEKLEEKLRGVPEENIREVEPEIAIPIMEKIAYTSNDDLAELYTNLLASASQKDKVSLVHPGFINKINSMAPDEAKILELFRKRENIEYMQFRAEDKNGNGVSISNKLTTFEDEIKIDPNTFQVHVENLISLSLVEDMQDRYLVNDKNYKLIEDKYYQFKVDIEEKNMYGNYNKLKTTKSYYRLSKVGEIFIQSCIK